MTQLPASEALDLDLEKGWLTVWFNDPANRNPLSAERAAALIELCEHLEHADHIRGVILRGRGGVFCAGGDLKAFKSAFQGNDATDAVIEASLNAGTLMERLSALPQFVIAAVEGAAMAGGFGLACCADYVVGEAGAKYGLSEVRIGITPSQIAPFVLRRLARRDANRLMLTGEPIKSQEAQRIGLIDEIAEGAEAVDAALHAMRAKVQKAAPGAVAATKMQIALAEQLEGDARKRSAADLFAQRMMSEEGREGVASFVEKRAPVWAVE